MHKSCKKRLHYVENLTNLEVLVHFPILVNRFNFVRSYKEC